MDGVIEAAVLGLGLGLGAGISPGPLLTLVVTSSLKGGFPAGARVAAAPLLSDLPIIATALLLLSRMPAGLLRGIALAGGGYVLFLGLRTLAEAARGTTLDGGAAPPSRDLPRAALVNLLNPHAWLFWLGVGGPTLVTFGRRGLTAPVVFVLSFWLLIVGSKVAIAWLVARGRALLRGRAYSRALGLSGLVLVVMGLLLVRSGFTA